MNATATPETFYVMQVIEGDECVVFHAHTFEEAKSKIDAYVSGARPIPAEELAIWSSRGRMLAWIHNGAWIDNRPAP